MRLRFILEPKSLEWLEDARRPTAACPATGPIRQARIVSEPNACKTIQTGRLGAGGLARKLLEKNAAEIHFLDPPGSIS